MSAHPLIGNRTYFWRPHNAAFLAHFHRGLSLDNGSAVTHERRLAIGRQDPEIACGFGSSTKGANAARPTHSIAMATAMALLLLIGLNVVVGALASPGQAIPWMGRRDMNLARTGNISRHVMRNCNRRPFFKPDFTNSLSNEQITIVLEVPVDFNIFHNLITKNTDYGVSKPIRTQIYIKFSHLLRRKFILRLTKLLIAIGA